MALGVTSFGQKVELIVYCVFSKMDRRKIYMALKSIIDEDIINGALNLMLLNNNNRICYNSKLRSGKILVKK